MFADRIREMFYPLAVLFALGSLWVAGHAKELESRTVNQYLPPADPDFVEKVNAADPERQRPLPDSSYATLSSIRE